MRLVAWGLAGALIAGALIAGVAACMPFGGSGAQAPPSPGAPLPSGAATVTPTEDPMATSSAELPPYLMIRSVTAVSAGASVALEMVLAASVPPGSPVVGMAKYRFLIDGDGDREWDWSAALELRPGGGYVPVLSDRAGGQRQEGPAFPGTANLAGSVITMSVRFDALGCPPALAVRGRAEETRSSATISGESPPDGSWVTLETTC